MALRCEECNIQFDSQQLYETHKRKFCVGSSVDPSGIHSRISGTSGKKNIPPGEDFSVSKATSTLSRINLKRKGKIWKPNDQILLLQRRETSYLEN